MKNNEPKMAQFLDRLTHQEMQIICHQVRTHSGEQRYAHLHPGLLPFVPFKVVNKAILYSKAVRPVAVIISKLDLDDDDLFHSDNTLTLNDRKVWRVFGKTPGLGRQFSWLPGKPVVALRCQHAGTGWGTWKVSVLPKHRAAVMCWLADNCTRP
jgi:hypothetical protein